MQKMWKMFLRANHLQQARCRQLTRSLSIGHSSPLPPLPRFILANNSRHMRMSSTSMLSPSEREDSTDLPSHTPADEEGGEGEGEQQRQFYIENPDKLLYATMTPELQQAVLEGIPNGEFALKKLLAEMQHLQTKKPYPLPLPEYLTLGQLAVFQGPYCAISELAKFRIVRGICLSNALLGPVCCKLTKSCFPCCGVLGFCRF